MSLRSCQELWLSSKLWFCLHIRDGHQFWGSHDPIRGSVNFRYPQWRNRADVTVTVPPHKCSANSDITQTQACFKNVNCVIQRILYLIAFLFICVCFNAVNTAFFSLFYRPSQISPESTQRRSFVLYCAQNKMLLKNEPMKPNCGAECIFFIF